MQFFLDTANLAEMRAAKAWGLLDGVTTNPTLMAREGGDWRAVMQSICREVEGPVSLEAVGDTADELIAMGLDLVRNGPNVVVKIPMTPEGLKAVRVLKTKGVDTNVTLVFSPMQALLAEVDMQRSEHVRRIWPFLRDRSIDAYCDLTKRYRD